VPDEFDEFTKKSQLIHGSSEEITEHDFKVQNESSNDVKSTLGGSYFNRSSAF
jgi:hypothetical protein